MRQPARAAWGMVAVLTALSTVSYIDRSLLNLLVDPVKRTLLLDDTQIALIQGFGFTLAYVIASPFCGRLADRVDRRLLLLGAGICWSAATALSGIATGFWMLLLCRLAVGATEAVVQPAAWSMLADRFPPERLPRAMSVFLISPYIGSGLALIFGGALIGSAGAIDRIVPALAMLDPWRKAYALVGLAGIAIAALLLLVREPERREMGGTLAEAEPTPSHRETIRFFWSERAFFGRFYVAMSGIIIILYAVPAWMPIYVSRRFGAKLASVGLQYGTLVLIAGTVGVLTGPMLVRLLERRGVSGAIVVGIVLVAIVLVPVTALIPFVWSYPAALMLGTLLTFLFSLPQSLGTSVLQIVTPPRMRGLSTAIYVVIVSITGLGAAPLVVALLTDHVFADPQKVGWSLGLVCFASAAVACWQASCVIGPYRRLLATQGLDARVAAR